MSQVKNKISNLFKHKLSPQQSKRTFRDLLETPYLTPVPQPKPLLYSPTQCWLLSTTNPLAPSKGASTLQPA